MRRKNWKWQLKIATIISAVFCVFAYSAPARAEFSLHTLTAQTLTADFADELFAAQASLASFFQSVACFFGFNCPAPPASTPAEIPSPSDQTPNNIQSTIVNEQTQAPTGNTSDQNLTPPTGGVRPQESQTPAPIQNITQIVQPTKEIQTIHTNTVTEHTKTVIVDQDTKNQIAQILRQLDPDRPNYSAGQPFTLPANLGGTTLNISNNSFSVNSSGDATTNNLTTRNDLTVQGNFTVNGSQTYSGAAAFTATSAVPALSSTQNGAGLALRADDVTIKDATISTYDTNQDLLINPNGTGQVQFHSTSNYLDSDGNLILSGNLTANGSGNNYFSGNVGIGTTTPTSLLNVVKTDTSIAAGNNNLSYYNLTVNPVSDQPQGSYINDLLGAVRQAILGDTSIPADNTHKINEINGGVFNARNYGTGQTNYMVGVQGFADNAATATVSTLVGGDFISESDAGTVSNLESQESWSGAYGGTVTNMIGGVFYLDIDGASVTNRYGIKIGPFSGSATNDYSLYSAATQKSYFAGNVGIGTTNPYSLLNISSSSGASLTLSRNDISVTAGDTLGQINFWSNDTSTATNPLAAQIKVLAKSTIATDINPGILTFLTTPSDVAGALTERMRIDESGNVGIGTTSPAAPLQIEKTLIGASNYDSGIANYITFDPTSNNKHVNGLNSYLEIPDTNNKNISGIWGGVIGVDNYGSGTFSDSYHGITGLEIYAYQDGTGSVSNLKGINSYTSNYSSSSVGNQIQLELSGNNNKAGSTVTNYYGISLLNPTLGVELHNSGTITNTYGVYVGDITAGTQTNTPYSFYAYDPNAYNYFAGNVGIGTTSPSHALDIVGDAIYLNGANILTGAPANVVTYSAGNFAFSLNTTMAINLTRYLGAANTAAATSDVAAYVVPKAGVINKLYVVADANSFSAATTQFTLMKNGVAQALTCTLAAAALNCNDQSNSVSVSAGDSISMKVVTSNSGTGTITRPRASVNFDTTTSVFSSQWVTTGSDIYYTTGNVGIGTTSPQAKFHSKESGAKTAANYAGYLENIATNTTTDAINKYGLYITSTGDFTGSGGTTTTNYGLYIDTTSGADSNYGLVVKTVPTTVSAANMYYDSATGIVYYNASSERYKTNIAPLSYDYTKILSVQPKQWNLISDNSLGIGVVAEDLEKLGLPELVIYNSAGQADGIQWNRIATYMLSVIKDQQKQIEALNLTLGLDGAISDASSTAPVSPSNNLIEMVRKLLQSLGLALQDGVARLREVVARKFTSDEADIKKIQTEQICITGSDGETVCVNKDQLKDLINRAGSSLTTIKTNPYVETGSTETTASTTDGTISETENTASTFDNIGGVPVTEELPTMEMPFAASTEIQTNNDLMPAVDQPQSVETPTESGNE